MAGEVSADGCASLFSIYDSAMLILLKVVRQTINQEKEAFIEF